MTIKILVGTPCYGGNLNVNYFHAMRRLTPALEKMGIEIFVKTLAQESLICRARNTLVAEFLGRRDFTHLLFIDADIGFDTDCITRMLSWDRPVVCAACPMKGYNWEKILASAKHDASVEKLKRSALQFAVNMHDEDNIANETSATIDNGFLRVSKAGTGLMLIKREVFELLQARYPELKYVNDIAGYENDYTKGNFWTFFETMLHPQSKRYLSEDYAFCHRWTQGCQGEIWLNVASKISHFGSTAYAGSFLESLG